MARRPRRTGTGGEVARLLLRGALGTTMIAHGIKHARTLDGTAGWFSSIGFRRPALQARASAAVETTAGALLLAGAATPLAAAATVGTLTVAARSVHARNGFFITAEGWEYVANLGTAAVALAALGPGRLSVDHRLGLHRHLSPGRAAALTTVLGLASGAGQLALYWRDPATAADRGR
ncbi:DoxX family protein [Pseudonocardia parietis]|uniref:Oxidoreductase n=1 Tax=Pseudonocardia parietis TaxID=570936 RepID=A0ABS4VVC3_9PSEU|nr:DoxX family protein [Pseudonocardia parietis]MBP2367673.1 putative oxidoreductase [Pseudonocardia parietis]